MVSQYCQQVRYLDVDQGQESRVNVLVQGETLVALNPDPQTLPSDCQWLTTPDWIVAPALVDLYSTSGEPGHEDRETLAQLCQAAIAGGFGHVMVLPQGDPSLDQGVDFQGRQRLLGLDSWPVVRWWGSLTQGNAGQQLTEWGELAQVGVVGLTDGKGPRDWRLVQRGLEYGAMVGKPVALVPLHRELRGNGVMREGTWALQAGLPPDPVLSEGAAIALLKEILPAYATPVHLMRLSTARGVELVRQAKAEGLPITASVNWHYLLLDNGAIAQGLSPYTGPYDPNLRFDPPLGNPEDRLALIAGLATGVIDAIAVDHRALSYEDKTQTFAETEPGAIGYELILPYLWHQLVVPGHLSPLTLWRALTSGPLACLGLDPCPSPWIVFDPTMPWTVKASTLRTPAHNTPWWHQDIQGRVVAMGVGE